MLEYAQTALYGQFTEERMWGLVLLALSVATAAFPAWRASIGLNGYAMYAVMVIVGGLFLLPAAVLWGKVLSWVRQRWFA